MADSDRNPSDRKAVLVTRKTRIEELVAKFNTVNQARFYIERLGGDFSDYEREFAAYTQSRLTLEQALKRHCRVQVIDRSFVPTFLFNPDDVVIALGQDGVVANVLKYLVGQPLVGVNPDPARFDGALLPFGDTPRQAAAATGHDGGRQTRGWTGTARRQ
jgi:NAD kinase